MKNLLIFACIFLFSLFLRLPFFFEDVISWDESTFILMGQTILNGHLPYTKLWDNKPPIAFASHAFWIMFFGKSIVGIRFAGTAHVTVTSFCSYLIGEKVWNRWTGVIAGVFSVILISILPDGQATMTEVIVSTPLMLALCILTSNQNITRSHFFIVGSLLAIAAMIRLNLAYVSLILGCFIFAFLLKEKTPLRDIIINIIAYTLGHILIILATIIPYFLRGEGTEWWRSVVLAPLSYTSARASALQTLKGQIGNLAVIHNIYDSPYFLIGMLTWTTASLGITYALINWRKFRAPQRRAYIFTLVFYFSTALSIIKGGAAPEHYLIQIASFSSLLSAIFLGDLIDKKKIRIVILAVIVITILTTCNSLTSERYKILSGKILKNQQLLSGPSFEVADYIKQNRQPDELVYMMDNHIVYWLIDAEPLSKCSTHPSNITKSELFPYCANRSDATPESELRKILLQKPGFIVMVESYPWYVKKQDSALLLLKETLERDYRLAKNIEN